MRDEYDFRGGVRGKYADPTVVSWNIRAARSKRLRAIYVTSVYVNIAGAAVLGFFNVRHGHWFQLAVNVGVIVVSAGCLVIYYRKLKPFWDAQQP